MNIHLKDRDVRFFVQDGHLVRTVTAAAGDGRSYTHRCTKASFEKVAHAVAETPPEGEGTALGAVARRERIPFTQANVALEFLKERGLVDVRHRRCYPAGGGDVYLDAMVEFHALAAAAAGTGPDHPDSGEG
jgi:hypothetical protein